jgi:hypothetical protein
MRCAPEQTAKQAGLDHSICAVFLKAERIALVETT